MHVYSPNTLVLVEIYCHKRNHVNLTLYQMNFTRIVNFKKKINNNIYAKNI